MKTLQECKDEVARDKFYLSWNEVYCNLPYSDFIKAEDEAAELYAAQFHKQALEDTWEAGMERGYHLAKCEAEGIHPDGRPGVPPSRHKYFRQFHKQETAEPEFDRFLPSVPKPKQKNVERLIDKVGKVRVQDTQEGIEVHGTKSGKLYVNPEDLFLQKKVQDAIKRAEDTQEKTFNLEDLKSKIRDFLDVREDIHPPNLDREWVITGVDELAQFIFDKYGSEDTQEKPDFERIYITKCAQTTASNVWDKYVAPLKARIVELEKKNEK